MVVKKKLNLKDSFKAMHSTILSKLLAKTVLKYQGVYNSVQSKHFVLSERNLRKGFRFDNSLKISKKSDFLSISSTILPPFFIRQREKKLVFTLQKVKFAEKVMVDIFVQGVRFSPGSFFYDFLRDFSKHKLTLNQS